MLVREPGGKLGMSIRGGHRSKSGNPLDPRDEGIFISKVCFFVISFWAVCKEFILFAIMNATVECNLVVNKVNK